jgi:2',3'-cyclic-nucleotide 2'-phosphodiesterase/3'-nucleotidase
VGLLHRQAGRDHADFSNGTIPAGEVKLRDAYSVYIYENTLYVMKINGDILRRALEKNAEYFAVLDADAIPATPQECKAAINGPEYNWDLYSKIEYEIDATKPVGSRVTKLKFQGVDVTPEQPFTIAINNYRAGGGGSFDMFKEGTILWTSADGVRDYVASYVSRHDNACPAP